MQEEAVRALMRAEEGSKPLNSKHNSRAGVNEYRKIDGAVDVEDSSLEWIRLSWKM
jgi:hypothetical protein